MFPYNKYNDYYLGDAKMAVKKTPTKAAKPTKKAVKKVAVPAVRTAKPKGNAADMLSMLSGSTPVKKKSDAKARPTMELPAEVQELYAKFVPRKQLFDVFKSDLDITKDELKGEVFKLWVDKMFAQKAKPVNPNLAQNKDGKPDLSGVYIIQGKFKVHVESAVEAIETLVAVGMSEENAEKLIDAEIDFAPMSMLRSFNELVKGHKVEGGWADATAAEEAVAQKLMMVVMGQEIEPITDEERALVLVNKPNIQVKNGFLDRVVNYCESAEQLLGVFSVIEPVHYPRGGKFGISDTNEEKRDRLVAVASDVLTEALS